MKSDASFVLILKCIILIYKHIAISKIFHNIIYYVKNFSDKCKFYFVILNLISLLLRKKFYFFSIFTQYF